MKFMPKECTAACARVVKACMARMDEQDEAVAAAAPNPVIQEFARSMKAANDAMDKMNAVTRTMSAGKVVRAAAAAVADPAPVPAAAADAAAPESAPAATPAAPGPSAVVVAAADATPAPVNPAARFAFGNNVIEVKAAMACDPRMQSQFIGTEMVDGVPTGTFRLPSMNTWGGLFTPAEVEAFNRKSAPMTFASGYQ